MISDNNYLDSHQIGFQQRYGIHQDWGILNYGLGLRTPEEHVLSSAIEPFELRNSLSKGTVYFTTSDTSSGTSDAQPETVWFADDKLEKILVYRKQFHLADDLTWISPRKTFPPQWTIKERYDQVFNRVGQLITLPKNWDSYGGNAINEDCVGRTIEILKHLIELRDRTGISLPVPFVAPLSSGGIQIEWEEGERYLELSLAPEASDIEYFASDRTSVGDLSLEGSMKSVKNFEELLFWFIKGEAEDLGRLNFESFCDD